MATLGVKPQSIRGQFLTRNDFPRYHPRATARHRSGSTDISRYGLAFHLPDKEFRYLRTVIVTAAVYRGFSSSLAALPLTFRHRAGVSPYTSPYGFARTCVFSKQSLPAGLCDHPRLGQRVPSPGVVPLLPKLRGHFAEFLDHSSPERLGILYQTTCVGLGYGPTRTSLEAFLDSTGTAATPLRAPHHTSASWSTDLPADRPTCLARDNHRPGPPASLRHPITHLTRTQATSLHHPGPKASGGL